MESQEVEEKIKTLAKWVGESQNIVFFGGAGVSTESGIPDFAVSMAFITKSMISAGNEF